MKEALNKFKSFEIDKTQLKQMIGEDLYNVECPKPIVVTANDVSMAIQLYVNNEILLESLVDWVNVVWFTDLYEILESENDAIMSVLEVLETLDEENVIFSLEDFSNMLNALTNNNRYE